MPVVRYFFFAGAALIALLFISDAVLPKLPAADSIDTASDKPVIRINSDRKWPSRVVFDTSAPTIAPAQTVKAEAAAPVAKAEAAAPVPVQTADASAKTKARDALALLEPSEPKKRELKPQRKRKIARRYLAPPRVVVAQQPQQSGFFANNSWFASNTW